MSVEIQGVQGYEYQYCVTLLFALHYLEKDEVHIYVESEEDAKITFCENGMACTLYIQAKHHDKSVNFNEICTWLGHFGERQALSSLIQRIQDENSKVLFVTSGRCEDQLIPYLSPDCFQEEKAASSIPSERNLSARNKEDVPALKAVLSDLYSGDTKLQEKRRISIQNFLKEASDAELKKLLKRVAIVEQQSMEKVLEQISSMLNCHYVIKTSNLKFVIDRLDECVRNGRDCECDIVPNMRSIIEEYTQRYLPENLKYLEIPQQQACENSLEENHALLLTGLPFCGKTITAQAIAQKYAQLGFEILETADLAEAMAFFNNHSDEKRLLLLEDPFGSVQVSEQRAEGVRMLRTIVLGKTSTVRKVIATTRKDILLTAFNRKTIEECSVGNCAWIDLSMVEATFAQTKWRAVYGDTEMSLQCFKRIREHINRHEHGVFFEIGEIQNLKSTYRDVVELAGQKMDSILRAARVSSEDVVDKIYGNGRDSIRVFLALSTTCSTIRRVTYQELAYVLSGAEETPGLYHLKTGFKGVCLSFGREDETLPLPRLAYAQSYGLSESENRILIQLEQYGYIAIERREKAIRFLHPIFCYAGQLLFMKELQDALDCDAVLSFVRRAVGALDKNVNLCAVELLHRCIEKTCEYQEQLIDTLLCALDSRYPAVRDKALLWLETVFDELKSEQQKQLVDTVKNTEFDQYVLWQDGEAICYPENMVEVTLSWKKPALTMEQVDALKTRVECSAENMYNVLQSSLRSHLPVHFLTIALSYDESFIREAAIRLLFEYHAEELDVGKYLNEFEDCGVVCQMFLGALQAWSQYSVIARQQILDYFTNQLRRASVAVKAEGFLDKFAREDYTEFSWDRFSEEEKRLVWEAWCVAFTQFMRQFQADFVWMDQPHMDQCMNTMLQYVNNPEVLKPLFFAWSEWLHKFEVLSDYGMCLAEYILRYLSPNDTDRFALLQELLQEETTSLVTSHVKYLTNGWNLLTEQEHELVKNTLLAPREDQQWLQAIVLTREEVPSELQMLLLDEVPMGSSDWLSALRKKKLLEPCLNVHCGYPQPLWWNGYHHAFMERWTSIIAEELKTEPNFDGRAFKTALREFVLDEYNYSPQFEAFRDEVWNHLLLDEQSRAFVLEELLRATTSVNQKNKKIWTRAVNCCRPDELTQLFKKIADVIEAVEYYQDEGCYDLFDPDLITEYLYQFLPVDGLLIGMSQVAIFMAQKNQDYIKLGLTESQDMDGLYQQFEDKALNFYLEQLPRMKWTCKLVHYAMKLTGRKSPQLDSYLERQRLTSISRAKEQRKKFDDHYTVEKWRGK